MGVAGFWLAMMLSLVFAAISLVGLLWWAANSSARRA
jgi:hypothetical protein